MGFAVFICGCAQLYHVQVGSIDNRPNNVLIPFEIKVSETGVDVRQITAIQRTFFRSRQANQVGDLAGIISLFQMGPRTGYPVFTDRYADHILYQMSRACPTGRITGVTSIREQRKYPLVSGEIVKIEGYCIKTRKRFTGAML